MILLHLVHWSVVAWVLTVPFHPDSIFWLSKYTVFIMYLVWIHYSGHCPISKLDADQSVRDGGFIYTNVREALKPVIPETWYGYITPERFTVFINFVMICISFLIGLRHQ